MIDFLFILKRGHTSGGGYGEEVGGGADEGANNLASSSSFPSDQPSSGLRNSAQFIVDMLRQEGLSAALEIAVDGNSIDRLVHSFRPKIVVLEAIWCPPEKLAELSRLHPRVRWAVRIHSEIPFLALEGTAVDYLRRYCPIPRVTIAANSDRTCRDLQQVLSEDVCLPFHLYPLAVWLPNYYAPDRVDRPARLTHQSPRSGVLNIGCFGAIRPLKNHLTQALAAMEFARREELPLYFHINATRLEQGGQQVLKNLRALFSARRQASLAEHGWLGHHKFLHLLRRMDLSLAVSFTESFNIVTADAVAMGVPVVASRDVRWVCPRLHADPCSVIDIAGKMNRALGMARKLYVRDNWARLEKYNRKSIAEWRKAAARWL